MHHCGYNFYIIIDLASEQAVPAEAKQHIDNDLKRYARTQFASVGIALKDKQKFSSPFQKEPRVPLTSGRRNSLRLSSD